jgi:hypothetical protein
MAKAKAPVGDILAACDRVRDDTLPALGVRLEDRPDSECEAGWLVLALAVFAGATLRPLSCASCHVDTFPPPPAIHYTTPHSLDHTRMARQRRVEAGRPCTAGGRARGAAGGSSRGGTPQGGQRTRQKGVPACVRGCVCVLLGSKARLCWTLPAPHHTPCSMPAPHRITSHISLMPGQGAGEAAEAGSAAE